MMAHALPTSPAAFNRRQFLQITAVAGAFALVGGLGALSRLPAAATTHHAARTLMGTQINLTVVAPDRQQAAAAIATTFGAMERLIAYFDHRQLASPLAVLNRTGDLPVAPPELLDLLQRAIAFGELTAGAFDVTMKPLLDARQAGGGDSAALRALVDFRQIDIVDQRVRLRIPGAAVTLDGIAKGRVIDGGVAALQQLGFDQILVEAGGDLRALGARADGTPWRVGLVHPRHVAQGAILSVLPIGTQAVATSGDYMNSFTTDFSEHHIIDPRSGRSPVELASATVLAATALDADALGTAFMVMGSRAGLALAEALPNVEAVLVTKTLRVLKSSGVMVA
jgi:thiamine biosynthesis lipoprotein